MVFSSNMQVTEKGLGEEWNKSYGLSIGCVIDVNNSGFVSMEPSLKTDDCLEVKGFT